MFFGIARRGGIVGIAGGVAWVFLSFLTIIGSGGVLFGNHPLVDLSIYALPTLLFLPALMTLYLHHARLVGWWGRLGILAAGAGLGWLLLYYSGLGATRIEALFRWDQPVTAFHLIAAGLIFTGFVAIWRQPVLQPLPRWSLLAIATGICGLSITALTMLGGGSELVLALIGMKLLFGTCWALMSYTLLVEV